MAEKNNANIGFEKQIWDAACVLWGHIPAAEYRKVIVGLIFLRYISSAFEKRYEELVKEGDGFENDRDAYAEKNIFYVPKESRWSKIASKAHTPEIGTIIDDAMRAIEKENTSLKNVLPKNYASPDLDKRVLGEVVDLFTNEVTMDGTEASKDLLGRTYEYCIAQFAAYEGTKGGEFYTPASIVKTIVAILKPFNNCRVYDPCCGKSTIINIASRFYEPTKGEVFIDGINYKEMPLKWVQMNLGYVLQTPYLFRGSIRDNILYGRDDATEEEMLRAAEVVGLDEIVKSFKDGYDTDVGEGGGKLSQGEKQLVSFARALIKDPAILILDEATSSVDTYQEKRIQDAIEKLLEGRTSITVAHRLSTIVTSDRILYIHQGRIAEMGTHKELIAKKGMYYQLYRNQYIESQLENI